MDPADQSQLPDGMKGECRGEGRRNDRSDTTVDGREEGRLRRDPSRREIAKDAQDSENDADRRRDVARRTRQGRQLVLELGNLWFADAKRGAKGVKRSTRRRVQVVHESEEIENQGSRGHPSRIQDPWR